MVRLFIILVVMFVGLANMANAAIAPPVQTLDIANVKAGYLDSSSMRHTFGAEKQFDHLHKLLQESTDFCLAEHPSLFAMKPEK